MRTPDDRVFWLHAALYARCLRKEHVLNLEVIGQHVDITPAVRESVARRADKLQKFFDRIHGLRVIIGEEGTSHQAEFVAHLVKSDTVVAKATGQDLFATIDAAADKLEHQLRRYKERLREHRPKGDETTGVEGAAEQGE